MRPVDTRDTLGLALGLSYATLLPGGDKPVEKGTWDGTNKGFGVFRM